MNDTLIQNLVDSLSENKRLSGVCRPIIEAVVQETLQSLRSVVPNELQDEGLEALHGDWSPCVFCSRLAVAPLISSKWSVHQTPICKECREHFNKSLKGMEQIEKRQAMRKNAWRPASLKVLEELDEQYKEQGGIATFLAEKRLREEQERHEEGRETMQREALRLGIELPPEAMREPPLSQTEQYIKLQKDRGVFITSLTGDDPEVADSE